MLVLKLSENSSLTLCELSSIDWKFKGHLLIINYHKFQWSNLKYIEEITITEKFSMKMKPRPLKSRSNRCLRG